MKDGNNQDKKHLVDPRLMELIKNAEGTGIFINQLKENDVIELTTKNHTYILTVIDPSTKKVRMSSDNPELPDEKITYVTGCSLTGTGTMVKSGWIGVGYPLWLGGNNVLLSPIKTIKINGKEIK